MTTFSSFLFAWALQFMHMSVLCVCIYHQINKLCVCVQCVLVCMWLLIHKLLLLCCHRDGIHQTRFYEAIIRELQFRPSPSSRYTYSHSHSHTYLYTFTLHIWKNNNNNSQRNIWSYNKNNNNNNHIIKYKNGFSHDKWEGKQTIK